MFRQQYRILVLKCCCSFTQHFILVSILHPKLFTLVFCTTPFGTLLLTCASHNTLQWVVLLPLPASQLCSMVFEVIRFLVPFHASVILKFAQHRMLKGYCLAVNLFYLLFLLLKPCNFNYSNLLLLINNSVGISHCNHQPCSHIS